MKFSLNDNDGSFIITAYDKGTFNISGKVHQGSQLVWTDRPPVAWSIGHINELSAELINEMDLRDVTTLLIGTGENIVFPADEILVQLHQASVGVEIMDTPAACRTYNILTSEDRQVAAALIAI